MTATKPETSKQVAQKSSIIAGVAYSVVHTIPGRIRFRVPLVAHDLYYAQRLQELLESDSHILEVRVNPWAASVAIRYEQSASNRLIEAYLVGLLHQAKFRQPSTVNRQQVTKSDNAGVKLPVLATVLAVLGLGFPIPRAIIAATVGLAALPGSETCLY